MRFEKLQKTIQRTFLSRENLLVITVPRKVLVNFTAIPPYSIYPRLPKLGFCNFTDIVRSRFPGSAEQSMAECSDTRKQRMSGELTSATTRRKKSSNLMASPSSSGKNENGICCPTPITISPSGIKEAGKSIVEQRKSPSSVNRRIHSPPFWAAVLYLFELR